MAHELENFAYIAQAQDQPARAVTLLAAAEALQEGIGTSALGVERIEDAYERAIAWLHAQLNEAEYDSCWSKGCGMSLDEAVAYALEL